MVAPANRFSNVPNCSAEAELATPPMAIAARPAIAICLSRGHLPGGPQSFALLLMVVPNFFESSGERTGWSNRAPVAGDSETAGLARRRLSRAAVPRMVDSEP